MIKSVVNPLSYSFATFATDGIPASQIMPIFWKSVKYLQSINLKVIAATGHGASQNKKLFRMCKYLLDNETVSVYSTLNI